MKTLPRSTDVDAAISKIGTRLDTSPLALLLDIDGTLAPIAPTPSLAQVPAATRKTIERLAALPGVIVAAVSGRSASDAQRLLGVPGAWVIGNHGYEVMQPGDAIIIRPDAAQYEAAMADAAKQLASVEMIEGALLEHKRWTLSVHYRNVAQGATQLQDRVRRVATELGLRVTEGKKVIELRPPIEVDKGSAALEFALRHRALPDGAVLYAGDDRTDEDAFRALRQDPRAVTLHVGQGDTDTAAELELRSPEELAELLAWLLRRRAEIS
jgi:trehalose 6-phosphate phosphatase